MISIGINAVGSVGFRKHKGGYRPDEQGWILIVVFFLIPITYLFVTISSMYFDVEDSRNFERLKDYLKVNTKTVRDENIYKAGEWEAAKNDWERFTLLKDVMSVNANDGVTDEDLKAIREIKAKLKFLKPNLVKAAEAAKLEAAKAE